jgi:hypothetical protein
MSVALQIPNLSLEIRTLMECHTGEATYEIWVQTARVRKFNLIRQVNWEKSLLCFEWLWLCHCSAIPLWVQFTGGISQVGSCSKWSSPIIIILIGPIYLYASIIKRYWKTVQCYDKWNYHCYLNTVSISIQDPGIQLVGNWIILSLIVAMKNLCRPWFMHSQLIISFFSAVFSADVQNTVLISTSVNPD